MNFAGAALEWDTPGGRLRLLRGGMLGGSGGTNPYFVFGVDRTSQAPPAQMAATSYCDGSQRDAQADITHFCAAQPGATCPFGSAAHVQQSSTS